MRVAAILTLSLCLVACGGREGSPLTDAAPIAGSGAMCTPWQDGGTPPDAGQLVKGPEQSLPGTTGTFASPVASMVGYACVTLPASARAAQLYCGAADAGTAPRPCALGEECAVGSIMVTELSSSETATGIQTCATFENWSPTRTRAITLWARPR